MLVMLRPTWPGSFSRSVRDESGAILETLVFQDREPLDLSEEQVAAVRTDIGAALVLVKENGKPDWEATAAFHDSGGDESALRKVMRRATSGRKPRSTEPVPAAGE